MRIVKGWLPLIFGMAAVWLATTVLLQLLLAYVTILVFILELGSRYGQ